MDSADGSLDAKYEYEAFGEPLRVGGTAIAADNPFRFSTKYTDTDGARERVDGDPEGVARRTEEAGDPWALMRQTGLIYHGFRYYSPLMGRFLNRDPIEELGGSNLYAFVENDPVNGRDLLGLIAELPESVVQEKGPRKRNRSGGWGVDPCVDFMAIFNTSSCDPHRSYWELPAHQRNLQDLFLDQYELNILDNWQTEYGADQWTVDLE